VLGRPGSVGGRAIVVRDSILGRGAVVAPGVLDKAMVGDCAFIGPGNELARSIRA
jgi:hypothetical protein